MWRFVGTQRISYKADLKTGENRPALDGLVLPEDAIVQRCMVPWPDSAEHGVAWVLSRRLNLSETCSCSLLLSAASAVQTCRPT